MAIPDCTCFNAENEKSGNLMATAVAFETAEDFMQNCHVHGACRKSLDHLMLSTFVSIMSGMLNVEAEMPMPSGSEAEREFIEKQNVAFEERLLTLPDELRQTRAAIVARALKKSTH